MQTPVLQIIHVSDWHFRHRDFVLPAWFTSFAEQGLSASPLKIKAMVERLPAGMAVKLNEAVEELRDGIYGHDEEALIELEEVIKDCTVLDPEWNDGVTWLIDTGDISTFGDPTSIEQAQSRLEHLAGISNAQAVSIHGNHDAWPQTQPLFATFKSIRNQRKWLRDVAFPDECPNLANSTPISNTKASIDLYRLNSVEHGKIVNGLAFGRVARDKFWASSRKETKTQLEVLKSSAEERSDEGKVRNFRIVLSHHPIKAPEHFRYRLSMKMIDPQNSLYNQLLLGSGALGPLAHLVLSGHTHQTFPRQGELGQTGLGHLPDRPNSRQLIVGSLSKFTDRRVELTSQAENTLAALDDSVFQRRLRGFDEDGWLRDRRLGHEAQRAKAEGFQFPHQFQLLRFYFDEASPSALIVKRIIFGRSNGAGPFRILDVEDQSYPF